MSYSPRTRRRRSYWSEPDARAALAVHATSGSPSPRSLASMA